MPWGRVVFIMNATPYAEIFGLLVRDKVVDVAGVGGTTSLIVFWMAPVPL